jgi:TonB family protein
LHLTAASVGEQAIGRVSSVGVKFNELAFDAASAALLAGTAGQWHRVRLRVERSSAVIAIDDRVVSDVEGLSEFTGYLTLAGRDGAAEFKALRVEKLTGLGKPFGGGASGITDPGLERPRALVTSKPRYPKEPFDRGIQGAVLLEVVILADGAVGDIRVTRPLDSELDDAAIASARQWRFSPAVKAGQPMPVIVSMEVSFTIADRR